MLLSAFAAALAAAVAPSAWFVPLNSDARACQENPNRRDSLCDRKARLGRR